MLDIKTGISLHMKQTISQVQMESLNILSMSMTELREFLQNEEIENPLVEYLPGRQEEAPLLAYREYDSFYSRKAQNENREHELYQVENGPASIEDMIIMQLPGKSMGAEEQRIIDFCIHSLNRSGYLPISGEEIAAHLKLPSELVGHVLSELKELEPQGIFASGLEECLCLQVRGMEQEDQLTYMIEHHLEDVAGGKISSISREMKLSSVEVRKLIHIIKNLNPRPLNGYGEERAQYIFPDILLSFQDGQWTIRLNEKGTGNIGINDFYVHMMESAQDEELRHYFEERLKRARFIMNSLEQRRRTLEGITEGIIRRQSGYLLGREALKPMTLEELADERGIHKSTVSRAIHDKYLLAPVGCLLIRDLFTTEISGKNEGVSRSTAKERLKALVEGENKAKPFSDEQLAKLLAEDGISISRRTVAKYRTELGIGGAFFRREDH